MKIKLYLSAFAIWMVLAVIAILNGTIRVYMYSNLVSEQTAHVISAIILIAFILLVTYLFFRFTKIKCDIVDLILVGTIWVILTVIFEFGFGRYVVGQSWQNLLADYNVIRGRVWVLVLLTELLAPLFMGRLAKRRN